MEEHQPTNLTAHNGHVQPVRSNSAGHEETDARIGPIVLTGAGLALAVVIVGLIVFGIFQYLGTQPAARVHANPMFTPESQIPPEPRIEEHPAIGIQQLHRQEEGTLSTYGWVDRKTGAIRIPIDRAMQLELDRGFPIRKEPAKK
jgi:hypothetical protein